MNGLTEDCLPGGVHPAYDDQAASIRALMADGRMAVRMRELFTALDLAATCIALTVLSLPCETVGAWHGSG